MVRGEHCRTVARRWERDGNDGDTRAPWDCSFGRLESGGDGTSIKIPEDDFGGTGANG